jgi:hypothetical protein
VRGRGGRAAVVGECGFIGFCYEVEKGGRWGVSRALLDEGGIKEVQKAAQATEVGEDPRVGRLGPKAKEA